jgi:hypothetical protein
VVTLSFQNKDSDGRLVTTTWSFEPLRDTASYPDLYYIRDDGKDASGHLLRQPYFEQKVIGIQIPAAVLRLPEHFEKFQNLLRAIDARVVLKVGTERTGTAYTVDLGALVTFDRVNDVDRWRTYTITLYEEQPRDLTTWIPR